jgi:ornithine decarboxylase
MNPTLGPLFRWARDQGLATPTHLFCRGNARAAAGYLRSHLDARISFATKANTHPLMLATLHELVDEFSVTNLAHLRVVLDAGIAPERIAYINPILTPAIAASVLATGVNRFVVDDCRGLDLLSSIDGDLRITLRLRPEQDGQASRAVVRFGNTLDGVQVLGARALASGMNIEALSFFVGTHAYDLEQASPYRRALHELAIVHAKLEAGGATIPVVNIGGGFPGAKRRFHQRQPHFFDRISEEVAAEFPEHVTVLCEPGRFLSEPAMAMLAGVVADRSVGGHRMTYLDASAYGGLFETSFIDHGGADLPVVTDRGGVHTMTQLLGPIMDSFDVVKRDVALPALDTGDLLLFPNTGAYSWGYAATPEGVRQPDCVELPPELDELLSGYWTD